MAREVSTKRNRSKLTCPKPGECSESELSGLLSGNQTPQGWGEGKDPKAGLPPGAGDLPVSPGPHSPPRFASWSYRGATAASASGLGTARQQARSATGAETYLLFPGPHLPAHHHRHLDKNRTFSSPHQPSAPNGSAPPAALGGSWNATTRKNRARPSGTLGDSDPPRDSPIINQVPQIPWQISQ